MKVLVIGSGGREHAMAWKLSQSNKVNSVFVAPGNGGTHLNPKFKNIDLVDINLLADFAIEEKIDLTVIGPELPLSKGIVDLFRSKHLNIFGPTQKAAQLESSKDFAKDFMYRHKIPTAKYKTFKIPDEAHRYIDEEGAPIVIKADGLASGKGVIVAMTLKEAHDAIDFMLVDNRFGDAGAKVVIEEFLEGEEASFMVICDGKTILPLATSQDHKRLLDHDMGPNTGGMGAYSPAPIVTDEIYSKVMKEIIYPTIHGMANDGIPFTGFLYAGLMITKKGEVKTLEYNCRMGDPETQPILMRLKSDFFEMLYKSSTGHLDSTEIEWDKRTALAVVLASEGYPEAPKLNDEIHIEDRVISDSYIFHAGTIFRDNKLLTSGGRVLAVTALGDSVKEAQSKAYETINTVKFNGAQYRKDIGFRALNNN
ncbi:phosphoribosylamine--glycine ligase [Candidatus Methylopumilus rimovensis]|jgi:phosphoribosylamine--glycine ligase|uniref:Phosphoribosylamine--glycine ligase n=1 Tax=Candidatus Methylopumilus rimovensis TaxID=2588535 RepID=A0AAE6FTW8_9PROT|nr:phosphoribosylamine--glycine ligase [Candidatus Methylopumilus rimovensis]QDD12597.1 phosphoribosylamine--glycine ligase [Candidatus Methylopumilus rimovensis]QDD13900.1 phosphoribosylamine--glycine ligase [Candidatus Methylopumilus rimovensis]